VFGHHLGLPGERERGRELLQAQAEQGQRRIGAQLAVEILEAVGQLARPRQDCGRIAARALRG